MDYKEIFKKVALNIKIQRIRKHITQYELAELVNVHEKYIGKIESGKQNITLKTLFKISEALDVQIDTLFI